MSTNNFHDKKIILASKSDRRIQMLKELKILFESMPSSFDEPPFDKTKMSPTEYAIYNAKQKAYDVSQKVSNAFVIGMDTIGEYDGKVLGKPKDKAHAREMIRYLSGTTHQVITGICIHDADSGDEAVAAEVTHVTFAQITDNEIDRYLEVGKWQDVAAGYAIQGHGALFVEKIDGDYFNVVGFPIHRFAHLLKQIGINVFEIMVE